MRGEDVRKSPAESITRSLISSIGALKRCRSNMSPKLVREMVKKSVRPTRVKYGRACFWMGAKEHTD